VATSEARQTPRGARPNRRGELPSSLGPSGRLLESGCEPGPRGMIAAALGRQRSSAAQNPAYRPVRHKNRVSSIHNLQRRDHRCSFAYRVWRFDRFDVLPFMGAHVPPPTWGHVSLDSVVIGVIRFGRQSEAPDLGSRLGPSVEANCAPIRLNGGCSDCGLHNAPVDPKWPCGLFVLVCNRRRPKTRACG